MKNYRDWKGITETAREEGLERGLEEGMERGREAGKLEVARRLIEKGMTAEEAAELAGVGVEKLSAS